MTSLTSSHTKVEQEIARGTQVSIIELVQGLIEYAHECGVSDIHIDPIEGAVRVRFRIDGLLKDVFSLPKRIAPEVISRIKVMASLRSDEHQAPQDGRCRVRFTDNEFIDVRVSIVPTYYGENAVLRLLIQKKEQLSLMDMGLSEHNARIISRAMKRPHGMILTTGPTGSGKTTTLYRLAEHINKPEISIVTIEDPIEYSLSGIEQVQVNPRSGLTFANGLRALLRQDPDVIMVGEIRDPETAAIAVNSALTGHLVLTTLHTNDAASTLPRLFDMKIDPYLVASTVSVVIAQRLVRKICTQCSVSKTISATEMDSFSLPIKKYLASVRTVHFGKGCAACNQSGYSGRVGLYEVLEANDKIKNLIFKKASSAEIKKTALQNGMTTLLYDGLHKVGQGITTLEEVLRIFHD